MEYVVWLLWQRSLLLFSANAPIIYDCRAERQLTTPVSNLLMDTFHTTDYNIIYSTSNHVAMCLPYGFNATSQNKRYEINTR